MTRILISAPNQISAMTNAVGVAPTEQSDGFHSSHVRDQRPQNQDYSPKAESTIEFTNGSFVSHEVCPQSKSATEAAANVLDDSRSIPHLTNTYVGHAYGVGRQGLRQKRSKLYLDRIIL